MSVRLALVLTLAFILASGSLAMASEVDEARDAAEAAQRERDAAADANAAAGRHRNDVEARVAAAFERLWLANTNAAAAAAKHVELIDQLGNLERQAGALRRSIEDRAVEAYMRSAFGSSLMLWQAESFEELALLTETAREAASTSGDEIVQLEETRSMLVQIRHEAESEAVRLERLNAEAAVVHEELEALFVEADAVAAATLANLAVTEAAYDQALTELEEAERRAAALAGVEHWRPLVETYFPEYLVEDALRVMKCESSGNPDAVNPTSGASGLFQFLDTTWAWVAPQVGMGGRSRFDPEANVASAAWLVDFTIRTAHPRGTWAHWTCQP